MKLSSSTLAVLLAIGSISSASAEVLFQQNNVIVGYEYLLDAEDKNPNLYDQAYFVLGHTIFIVIAVWALIRSWSGNKMGYQQKEKS